MELIKVPTDINDIADLTEFRQSIETINNFNQNLQKFGQKILDDKFLKTAAEWKGILTLEVLEANKEVLDRNKSYEDRTKFLFCYDIKQLIVWNVARAPTTGACTGMGHKISFSDDGTVLAINQEWSYTMFRGPSQDYRPVNRIITIDYVNGKILRF